MRVLSRLPPARGRIESSGLGRWIVCLALLSGCAHAVSEETNDGLGGIEPGERVAERAEGIGKAADGAVRVVVVDCDVQGEERCGESGELPGQLATGVGKAASLVDGGAGESVDEVAGPVATVGECSGRRFKKCR